MPQKKSYSDDVFTVANFLTSEECENYIAQAESLGFDDAPITTAFGPVMAPDVRNNSRVMVDAVDVAEALWERAKEFAPDPFRNYRAIGLNERLRFYRYDVGQQFNWHHDGYFGRDDGDRSQFTFMIYLNEDFEGGETSFGPFESPVANIAENGVKIVPQTGMALFFRHLRLHKGEMVTQGRKYVLRSDVMYLR